MRKINIDIKPDIKAIRRNLIVTSAALILFSASGATIERFLGFRVDHANAWFVAVSLLIMVYEYFRFSLYKRDNFKDISEETSAEFYKVLEEKLKTKLEGTNIQEDQKEKLKKKCGDKKLCWSLDWGKKLIIIRWNGTQGFNLYRLDGCALRDYPLLLLGELVTMTFWEFKFPALLFWVSLVFTVGKIIFSFSC